MTQDERWQAQYDQMMTFMNENHRRSSKHRLEEHDLLNWYKHVKKAIAKGNYPPHRIEKFAILLQVANKYRRKNQYEKQVNESTGQQVYEFFWGGNRIIEISNYRDFESKDYRLNFLTP